MINNKKKIGNVNCCFLKNKHTQANEGLETPFQSISRYFGNSPNLVTLVSIDVKNNTRITLAELSVEVTGFYHGWPVSNPAPTGTLNVKTQIIGNL
jgi:hypothetical protein